MKDNSCLHSTLQAIKGFHSHCLLFFTAIYFEVGALMISTLQMKKLKLRDGACFLS